MNNRKKGKSTVIDLLPVLRGELLELVVFLEDSKIVLLLDLQLRVGHAQLFASL